MMLTYKYDVYMYKCVNKKHVIFIHAAALLDSAVESRKSECFYENWTLL